MNCKGWGVCCRAPRPSVCVMKEQQDSQHQHNTWGAKLSAAHTRTPTAALHPLIHCTPPPRSAAASQQSARGWGQTHTYTTHTLPPHQPCLSFHTPLVHWCIAVCCCCCWRRCITALLNAVSRGPSCAWACRQDQNPGRRGVATPSPVGASRSRCGTIVKGVEEVHVVCGGECVVEGAAVCCYCCCC